MKLYNQLLIKQYFYFIYLVICNSLLRYIALARKPKHKFIIISRSRTGSTMLVQHIRKIPHSFIIGEILGRSQGFLFWRKFPLLFYKYHWFKYSVVGFKYFYYHPVDNNSLNHYVYDFLKRNQDIKIIHLIREDLFAVILSKIIAERTGQWSKGKKEIDSVKPFEVNEDWFKKEIRNTVNSVKEVNHCFQGRPNYLFISYEDIVEKNGLAMVYELLGHSISSRVDNSRKQKTVTFYSKILNYKALQDIYEQEKKTFSNYTGEA